MKSFERRSYNLNKFGQDLVNLIRERKAIKTAQSDLSKSFIRHIMLASTAINQCRYCAWGHTLDGVSSGEDYAILESILQFDLNKVPREERVALKFAMTFAEKEGNIDNEDIKTLYQKYGSKAKSILTITKMINFGNLLGNTIDAFRARMKGMNVKDGSLFLEFHLYLLGSTLFLSRMSKSNIYKKMGHSGIVTSL